MDGKGVMNWPNGERFEGDFKMGKISGKGTKYYNNGNKYTGEWANDA